MSGNRGRRCAALVCTLPWLAASCVSFTKVDDAPIESGASDAIVAGVRVVYLPGEGERSESLDRRVRRAVNQSLPDLNSRFEIAEGDGATTLGSDGWPKTVEPLRAGETAVLISGGRGWSCGTGMGLALLSFTLLPGAGGSPYAWQIVGHRPDGTIREVSFTGSENTWIWLPLVVVMPFNLAWRAVAGDVEDRFVDALPDLLRAALAASDRSDRPTPPE